MQKQMTRGIRLGLFLASTMTSTIALAQTKDAGNEAGIADIIVTAQKREQNLQDVPVSVAVIGKQELANDRITSLQDVGAIASGVSIRKTTGGLGSPQIVIRGVASAGLVAGSDKSVSINIDGVYIGANYGLTTDMLDLVRVEALRGPQGTLFGRNTTGGAISFVTADPTGKFGVRQEASIGNYDQFRSITHIELPQAGPFSGYVSYMRNQREGDIKNLQSGVVFDRSNAAGYGRNISTTTLGDNKTDAVRVALKFKPSNRFDVVYKFDYAKSITTSEGSGLIGYDAPTATAFGLGALNTILAANPPLISGTTRPDAVRNAFAVPGVMKSQGHTLVANLTLSDSLSLKSISAYRKVSAFGTVDSLALGQLVQPGSANPLYVLVNQYANDQKQWSEELQANYNSHLLTLTVGGLFFREKVATGSPDGLSPRNALFGLVFDLAGNVLPAGRDISFLTSRSLAAYGQAEFHVTDKLDVVGGIRVTGDKKNGTYYQQFAAPGSPLTASPFTYQKTKVTYLAGLNFRVTDDVLTYAKFSTGYISGGSVAGVPFDPETAESWEVGVKSELFDRRLRLNLAGFFAKYGNLQQTLPGYLDGRPDLNLVLINYGKAEAKGFEAEATLVPINGLTLSGAASYTDFKFTEFTSQWRSAIIGQGGNPATFPVWLRPSTTANLAATYESEPAAALGGARLMIRFDTNYRSKVITPGIFTPTIQPSLAGVYRTGGNWISNARIALKGISLGSGKLEVAGWARNLTNNRGTVWGNFTGFAASTTYEPARTYGLDLIVSF